MKFSEANLQFGRNLTALRKKAGLTRKQLADILNVTEMSVGTYERGIRTPSLERILQLADLFKVSTDELLQKKKSRENSENISNLVTCRFEVGNQREEFHVTKQNIETSIAIVAEVFRLMNAEFQKI